MPFSRTMEDRILSWFKATNLPSPPATMYVALLTANPTDGTGTGLAEVVTGTGASQWNGYARVALTTSTGWSAIGGTSPRQINNANPISFGTAVLASGSVTIVGFALYDASTSGTFLGWGTFSAGLVVTNGKAVSLGAGALIVQQ